MTWNTDLSLVAPQEPVLVWDGTHITVAHKSEHSGRWFVHESYGFNEDGEIYNVTHWMPLPEPPHGS